MKVWIRSSPDWSKLAGFRARCEELINESWRRIQRYNTKTKLWSFLEVAVYSWRFEDMLSLLQQSHGPPREATMFLFSYFVLHWIGAGTVIEPRRPRRRLLVPKRKRPISNWNEAILVREERLRHISSPWSDLPPTKGDSQVWSHRRNPRMALGDYRYYSSFFQQGTAACPSIADPV